MSVTRLVGGVSLVLVALVSGMACGSETSTFTGLPDGGDGGGGSSGRFGFGDASCKAKTCEELGANCGPMPDGCNGTIQCGTCNAPGEYCGGGGPSKCGHGTASC